MPSNIARLLGAIICAGVLAAGDTPEQQWAKRREQILSAMQEVMGPLPKDPGKAPEFAVLAETVFPHFIRKQIRFASGDGDFVPAYLFIPVQTRHPAPAVLCLHQTIEIGKGEPAGLDSRTNLHYALELAEQGYVTLAPDYPGFGDYHVDPYAMGYASATMKGIRNHRRAIDLLVSMAEVDPRRIGVIGHSLGGHNALFLAAFDSRIAAVVTSCGFTSFAKYYGGDLTGWSHRGYMPRIASVYDKSPQKMPFDFSDVLVAIAPRPVFINAPVHDANFDWTGVDDCVRSAQSVYTGVFHRPRALRVAHPDSPHDFPPQVRKQAYAFIAEALRRRGP